MFTSVAAGCRGDCDMNGEVTAAELEIGVETILGREGAAPCPALADDADVTSVVAAVVDALGSCRPHFTPTPTVTPTPSPTQIIPLDWIQAFDATDFGWVLNAWGPGDGTFYAVGGTNAHGRIFHLADGAWSEIDPGIDVPLLNWVHGTSAGDVFIGGNGGTILHWDGSHWTQQSTPASAPIWGLWAVASDDVWAVGGDPGIAAAPFVLHYDGRAWSQATLPALVRPRVYAFFKVWASGAGDMYVVGQNGVVLHYDGTVFTELFVGVSQDLIGVWGTGPDDVMVVGGRGTAEIVHWDGSQWHRASAFAYPGLNGVWMRRREVAHAVGVGGLVVRIDPGTLAVTEETDVPTQLDLHSIFGDASGRLMAVGGNFVTPEHGVALTRRITSED